MPQTKQNKTKQKQTNKQKAPLKYPLFLVELKIYTSCCFNVTVQPSPLILSYSTLYRKLPLQEIYGTPGEGFNQKLGNVKEQWDCCSLPLLVYYNFLERSLTSQFHIKQEKTESEVSWILRLRKICTSQSLFLKIIPLHSSGGCISADAQRKFSFSYIAAASSSYFTHLERMAQAESSMNYDATS